MQDDGQRPVVGALGDQPGVLGHILAHRALLHAGGSNTVKDVQPRLNLGQAVREVTLLVARLRQRAGGCLLQVGQLVPCQLIQAAGSLLSHIGGQVLQPLHHPRVAARLEQIGGGRDRPCSRCQDGARVQRVGPGRVGNVQVAVKLHRQLVEQVHGDRVQGPARHVHLVAGQLAPVVGHGQRVAQLDPKGQPPLGGDSLQLLD